MDKRAKWGLITALTVGLITPLWWQGMQPVPPDTTDNPRIKSRVQSTRDLARTPDNRQAEALRIEARKNKGNEQIVAKDVARTAALCVRDCRIMLTEISNELAHTKTPEQREQVLRHHMKEHPQFVGLTLRDGAGTPLRVGRVLAPELQDQAHDYILHDNFYISDLYQKQAANDPKEQIGMTLGVPLLGDSNVTGTLVADVEMGLLMSVMNTQDQQLGTQSTIVGANGKNEALGYKASDAKGGITAQQITGKKAIAKVDGTAWQVHALSVQGNGHTKPHSEILPQELLVQYAQDLTQVELARVKHDLNVTLVRKNSRHTYIFRLNQRQDDLSQEIAYFKKQGARIAEPHIDLHPNTTSNTVDRDRVTTERVVEEPNDMFYGSNQWNLPIIAADQAWQISTGSSDIKVAVVDTGVDLAHPEFKGQLVQGVNFVAGTDNPQDDNGHGTHVSGIIAARTNNLEGIAGLDWAGKIMPVKTMASDGSGSVVDISDGVRWAVDHGARVINMSLGEYNDSDYLHDAIKYAYDKGAVIVSAMGNDGIDTPSYPAAYPEVIAVAANDETTESALFSNWGPHTSVSAPGVSIPSTYPGKRYVAMSGTSMATPHVAGVAALLLSINPDLTPKDVRHILESTADDLGPEGKDEYYGYGQINVAKAVRAARATLNQ
ncbi:MAG TPA: S8 family serine peptidase [Bacilli bacterium]|nr:S8 family serine peptidase [Bacilli bacterium]